MTTETDPSELSRRLVYLAAERTLTSWLRTALSLMALGFVLDRLDLFVRHTTGVRLSEASASRALASYGGSVLVGLGVIIAVASSVHYLRFARGFQRDRDTDVGRSLSVGSVFGLVLGAFGIALVVVLASLLR